MKTINSYLSICLLTMLLSIPVANAQWADPGIQTHNQSTSSDDPRISGTNPDLEFNTTGNFYAGLQFLSADTSVGYFLMRPQERQFGIANTQSLASTVWSVDLDEQDVAVGTNGFFNIGRPSSGRMTFDYDDIQVFNSADNGITLHLNRYGGHIDLLGFNNTTGDLNVDYDGLFYDNSEDRVGIGLVGPRSTLHVRSNYNAAASTSTAQVDVFVEDNAQAYVGLSGVGKAGFVFDNDGSPVDAGLLFDYTNDNITFRTNGTDDRMVINEIGEIGIGLNSPEATVHIQESAASNTGFVGSSVDLFIEGSGRAIVELSADDVAQFSFHGAGVSQRNGLRYNYANEIMSLVNNGFDYLTINKAGNVGVGVDSSVFKLQVAGDVDVTGELTAASDERIKKNIRPIEGAVSAIHNLRPVSYEFRTTEFPELVLPEKRHLGLIAQDVEAFMPDLVTSGSKTLSTHGTEIRVKSINYIELIPLLISSIQELETALAAKDAELIRITSEMQDAQAKMLERIEQLERLLMNN